MVNTDSEQDLASISERANKGFYLAIRVGFHFPMIEVNELPRDWVAKYTQERLLMFDPLSHWVYSNTGTSRWSEIILPDPRDVLGQAAAFGLRFGAVVSTVDPVDSGYRSFGNYARDDREFTDDELDFLYDDLVARHNAASVATSLTDAEIEALRLMRDGLRLKQIAYELGVSEGAIKQRIKNARQKLGASTSAQAVSKASSFKLI